MLTISKWRHGRCIFWCLYLTKNSCVYILVHFMPTDGPLSHLASVKSAAIVSVSAAPLLPSLVFRLERKLAVLHVTDGPLKEKKTWHFHYEMLSISLKQGSQTAAFHFLLWRPARAPQTDWQLSAVISLIMHASVHQRDVITGHVGFTRVQMECLESVCCAVFMATLLFFSRCNNPSTRGGF